MYCFLLAVLEETLLLRPVRVCIPGHSAISAHLHHKVELDTLHPNGELKHVLRIDTDGKTMRSARATQATFARARINYLILKHFSHKRARKKYLINYSRKRADRQPVFAQSAQNATFA